MVPIAAPWSLSSALPPLFFWVTIKNVHRRIAPNLEKYRRGLQRGRRAGLATSTAKAFH